LYSGANAIGHTAAGSPCQSPARRELERGAQLDELLRDGVLGGAFRSRAAPLLAAISFNGTYTTLVQGEAPSQKSVSVAIGAARNSG
jgi:hypothetical protein